VEGGGYDGDIREVDMSDGQIIDTVIASARQTVIKDRAVRAMEIANRREEAIDNVRRGLEAHRYLAVDGELYKEREDVIHQLVQRVEKTRISMAEAMGEMAKVLGVFNENPYWWEIYENGRGSLCLWKGYTRPRRICRVKFAIADGGLRVFFGEIELNDCVPLDMNIRQACDGHYVAHIYADDCQVVWVGDRVAGPVVVARFAYSAFCEKYWLKQFSIEMVPREFSERVDTTLKGE
jgi:hypothetical protein